MDEQNVDNQDQSQQTDNQDQQQQAQSWKTVLSEDIINHPSMANVPDVPTLAKNYVNQQEFIGRKGIIPPKEGDEADLNRYYNQIGRPETPDKYEVKKLDIPDNMKQYIREDGIDNFKSIAHKHGLLQKQFEGIMKDYVDNNIKFINGYNDKLAEQKEKALNDFKNEAGENYSRLVDSAENAMKVGGLNEEQIAEIKSSPTLLKAFSSIGSVLSDDVLSGQNSGSSRMTAEDIQAEIRTIIDDKDSPLHNAGHRDHARYLSRLSDLYKMKEEIKKRSA